MSDIDTREFYQLKEEVTQLRAEMQGRIGLIQADVSSILDHQTKQNGYIKELAHAVSENTHSSRNVRYAANVGIGLAAGIAAAIIMRLLGI